MTVWGTLTALTDVPAVGLSFEGPPPGPVLSVLPGGPGWRAGIRAGQVVIDMSPGQTELDWVLHSGGGGFEYYLTVRAAVAELRGLAPLAFLGLILALASAALAFLRARGASALATLAATLGALPLTFTGEPVASSIGATAMFALPAIWLFTIGVRSNSVRTLTFIASIVVASGWLAARFGAPDLYNAAETARVATVAVFALEVVAVGLNRTAIRSAVRSFETPTVMDLVALPLAVGVALALWLIGDAPPIFVGVALAVAAIAYIGVRPRVTRALDRLLFDELRERASIKAIEAERGRLAGEIHDEPLQELAGVIARLERNPAVSAETGSLRAVATHLRAVATELQPPVLEDLGLGPALAFLAQQADTNGGGVRVEVHIGDDTGVGRAARLPQKVELALFRIAQEAIGNAHRHSHGTLVTVSGELSASHADLSIGDDGVGLTAQNVREAQQAGRLGLSSMRQRAATIGAQLSVGPGQTGGTLVNVRWRR